MPETNEPVVENDNVNEDDKPVPYGAYRKLVTQRKNDQENLKLLTAKLDTYEKKMKDLEQNSPNTDYKSLLETRNKELEELNKSVKEKESVINDYEDKYSRIKKLSAFNEALPAKLKRKEYYAHVDVDKIVVDPDTGEVDQKSLKTYANQFAEDFKDLLDLKGGPNLPNAKSTGTATLSYEAWLALPASEMKKRIGEVRK